MTLSIFWCGSLRTGTLIVGWLTTVIVILNAISTAIIYSQSHLQEDRGMANDWTSYIEFTGRLALYGSPYLYIFYSIAILKTIVSACLLYGTYKDHRQLLVPYLIVFSLTVLSAVTVTVYRLVAGVNVAYLIPEYIAVVPIGLYFVSVVAVYYVRLRHRPY